MSKNSPPPQGEVARISGSEGVSSLFAEIGKTRIFALQISGIHPLSHAVRVTAPP